MGETNQAEGAETFSAQASEAANSLKDSAVDTAERQKKSGAKQLSGIAGAVHSAASELEQQMPAAASYVHDAAARIDEVAEGLRNRSLSDLVDDVRRLAHDRPMALFGGAVVAGFALSRFLKSGDGAARDSDRQTGA